MCMGNDELLRVVDVRRVNSTVCGALAVTMRRSLHMPCVKQSVGLFQRLVDYGT